MSAHDVVQAPETTSAETPSALPKRPRKGGCPCGAPREQHHNKTGGCAVTGCERYAGTWERWSPKGSPKHVPELPSPRTAPIRTPIPFELLDRARAQLVLQEAEAVLWSVVSPPPGKKPTLPKTALGRIFAVMEIGYRGAHEAWNHLYALAHGTWCKAYASYRWLAHTEEHERQMINYVGALEAYGTVETVNRWVDGRGHYTTEWGPGRTQVVNEYGLVVARWIVERLPRRLVDLLPKCILPRALRDPADLEADHERWRVVDDLGPQALEGPDVDEDAGSDTTPASGAPDPRTPDEPTAAAEPAAPTAAAAEDLGEHLDAVGDDAQRAEPPPPPPVDEARALFDRAVQLLRADMPPANFAQWFGGVQYEALDVDAGVLTLRAANDWVRDWVRDSYAGQLRAHLAGVLGYVEVAPGALGRVVRVEWTVGPVTDPVVPVPAPKPVPVPPRPCLPPASLASPSSATSAPARPAEPPAPLPAEVLRRPEVAIGAICELIELRKHVYRWLPPDDCGERFAARLFYDIGNGTDAKGKPTGLGQPLRWLLQGLWDASLDGGTKGRALAKLATRYCRAADKDTELPPPVLDILARAQRGLTARGPPATGPPAA